jgi:hypothetical protein
MVWMLDIGMLLPDTSLWYAVADSVSE